MKLLARIGTMQEFGEQRDAIRMDQIDHDSQPAVMLLLILSDQVAAQVARFVLGLEKRRVAYRPLLHVPGCIRGIRVTRKPRLDILSWRPIRQASTATSRCSSIAAA